jgi:hypothetical protein
MSIISVKVEDRLEGVSNFLPWKATLILLMKEQELWDVVTSGIPAPVPAQTAAQGAKQMQPVVDLVVQEALEKKDIKAQRVILEVVKDHLIPRVREDHFQGDV